MCSHIFLIFPIFSSFLAFFDSIALTRLKLSWYSGFVFLIDSISLFTSVYSSDQSLLNFFSYQTKWVFFAFFVAFIIIYSQSKLLFLYFFFDKQYRISFILTCSLTQFQFDFPSWKKKVEKRREAKKRTKNKQKLRMDCSSWWEEK